MKKIKNAALLILSMILSVTTVLFCGFDYWNRSTAPAEQTESTVQSAGNTAQGSELPESPSKPSEDEVQSGESQTETASSPEAESSSQTVQAASEGQAVGRIFEQFISPYSASLSYNNVYIKNTSGLSIDLKAELAEAIRFKVEKNDQPQVLIVHTHATECYMTEERDYYTAADETRTTDNTKNVVYIGEIMANILRNGGISVLHDETRHDYPSYTGSYERAADTINEYLQKYPSIKIVIDIHRDSISMTDTDRAKPTVEINGKKAAQVMLCMGSESGTVTGFPEWKQNFRLAARFQQTMEVMYPGLARAMSLVSKKYNENLTAGSMLLEVGTESNTLEEAAYAAELAGNALLSLLNTLG